MLNTQDDKPNNWIPYVIGMTATAVLSALGTELVRWAVDELRGRKPPAKKTSKKETKSC